MAQENEMNLKAENADALEKERRAATMDAIAETRKAFLENHQKNTARHLEKLAKSVGVNQDTALRHSEAAAVEKEYKAVEDEWLLRKEELMSSRKELAEVEHERLVIVF